MLTQIKFQVKKSINNEMLYMMGGKIIRIDQQETSQIMTNLEQIEHLTWQGERSHSFQKIGRWTADWNWNYEGVGGYYSENGQKQGQWKEMAQNFGEYLLLEKYKRNAKVYEVGEYENGVRIGTWNYVFENKRFGGGVYKENGVKNSKWIELSDNFSSQSQITYNGEYQDGKKFGVWTTMYRGHGYDEFIQIGGGQFDENQKNGEWIELSNFFSKYYFEFNNIYSLSQVIYQGHYLHGKKSGQWDTMARLSDGLKFAQIGGGFYDKNGKKQGKWVDLCNYFQSYVQILYNGQYQDDLKIGKWDTIFREYSSDKYCEIGGGSFDEKGMKIGNWIELSDGFYRECQIIYQGEYQNGLKVGRWEIMYRKKTNDDYQKIGGGLYDPCGLKDGIWMELENSLSRKTQVSHVGQYKNDKKYGLWEIMFIGEKMGGGIFDENGIKDGQWREISDNFSRDQHIFYQGEYQKGRRIGRWDIEEIVETSYDHEDFTFKYTIGGGLYDDTGLKEGIWLELSPFQYWCQILFTGEYKKGKKIGIWNTSKPNELIFGGLFDETGRKDGKWIELNDGFCIQKGEYQNGQKKGIWDILKSRGLWDKEYEKISETSYMDKI
ncbi:unnamed protein product [Paramecium pentaurelia]|uniref:Uncharacterized protein n=1 Tax=Paramecium pentaurelia TaxID=43138 RepID=A0A8S1X0I7_9CILI|nr:unnamed protein product [Paramecium pentaurelia]